MAKTKIRGITIELGADFTQLTEGFKQVTKDLKTVDSSLKDVNKLLKLDPTNVKLLSQQEKYLDDAIALSNKKLEEEKKMLEALPKDSSGKLTDEQLALGREIEATKIQLQGYKTQLDEVRASADGATTSTMAAAVSVEAAGDEAEESSSKWGNLGSAITGIKSGLELFGMAVKGVKQAYDALLGDTVKLADDLMAQSSVTGLSTDALQEYAFMAELVDTDVSTITGSLTKLTKNMNTASKGTGDTYEAFEKLGIAVTDNNGNLRDSEEVFAEVLGALGEMDNETEKNAVSMQIFGKSAQELNPLIDAGADSIEEYRKQAHEMGYVLDTETLGALGSIDDSLQMAKNSLDAVKRQIGTALAPVVAEITKAFADWAASVDWQKVGETIVTVLEGIGSAISSVIKFIKDIIGWISKAIEKAKEFFNGKWELPKLKLPHFSITPKGWKLSDLLKGTLPKLGIDWYAKGYDGMVLDGATVFGINKNGQPMVGGERGREIIIGENKLAQMLGAGRQMIVNVTVNEANNAEATAQAVINRMQSSIQSERLVWQ